MIKINVTCNDRYSILNKWLWNKQIDPYLVKNGDLPRISDGFSEISIGSKGLNITQMTESHPKFIKIKIVSEQAMTNVKYEIRSDVLYNIN